MTQTIRLVEIALAPIAEALAADGTSLRIERADDREVVIVLGQGPEACGECVMEPESLKAIISECLREAGLQTGEVKVL